MNGMITHSGRRFRDSNVLRALLSEMIYKCKAMPTPRHTMALRACGVRAEMNVSLSATDSVCAAVTIPIHLSCFSKFADPSSYQIESRVPIASDLLLIPSLFNPPRPPDYFALTPCVDVTRLPGLNGHLWMHVWTVSPREARDGVCGCVDVADIQLLTCSLIRLVHPHSMVMPDGPMDRGDLPAGPGHLFCSRLRLDPADSRSHELDFYRGGGEVRLVKRYVGEVEWGQSMLNLGHERTREGQGPYCIYAWLHMNHDGYLQIQLSPLLTQIFPFGARQSNQTLSRPPDQLTIFTLFLSKTNKPSTMGPCGSCSCCSGASCAGTCQCSGCGVCLSCLFLFLPPLF